MDLILQKNDPHNTVFLNSEGLPLYQVDTPTAKLVSRSRTTAIQKITGSTGAQMATVELHAWKRDAVVVWGRDVTPSKPSKFLSANCEIFNASDSRTYKWKLVVDGGANTLVAFFEYGAHGTSSKSRPPTLSVRVKSEGVRVLDEIIATFVYMELKRRRGQPQNHSNEINATVGPVWIHD